MRKLIFHIFVLAMSGLAGCATEPNEKMKRLQTYEQCVDQAKKNKKKLESCEDYLKPADSVKKKQSEN